MKNVVTFITVILVLCTALLPMTGCSCTLVTDTGFSGKYIISSYIATGGLAADNPDDLAQSGFDPETTYLDFSTRGKVELALGGTISAGSYTIDGNTITMTIEADTYEATLSDGRSTITLPLQLPSGADLILVFKLAETNDAL